MSGTSYTRQSTFSDGDTITAALFNTEYNQLVSAFAYASTGTTGHQHDGGAGEGGNIHTIGDQDFNNKIVVDSSNNRWSVYVEVGGSAVEQVRIEDGVVYPVTDSDVDLGTNVLRFKDAYIDSLTATGNLTIGGNIDVDGTIEFDGLSGTGSVTVTDILDQDDMSGNSATALATQQSIKAYVDSQVTAQDLDLTDGSSSISIDLDSEALSVLGGTGIDSTASGNGVTLAIDSTVTTLTGSQTLTNKTLTSPDVNTPDIDGGTIDGTVIGGSSAAAGSFTTVGATGNITVGGTVDGRDVATDGTKLDGIEASATADQTNAEIRTAVEAASDSNVFTDADHSKLNAIEASADVTDTANVTSAGALMDSELTAIASVKALNQGVATTDSPTFAAVTVNGNVEFDGLSGTGSVTVTDILDQDDMSGNSATALATQQSIKAYVDTQITAEDLDITTDSGTIAIDLDSETLTVSGGTGLDSSATGNAVTLAIDSTVATLTGSQTLTNKSLTAPTLTGTATVASLDISGNIDVDGTTNLDVVDIDGAVDMASTLTVAGAVTGSSSFATAAGGTFTTASGNDLNIVYPDSRSLFFKEGSTTTLTLDNAQGATFAGVVTANAGVVVDTMTLDGSTLSATGDFILDSEGDIIFDANGADFLLKDAGTLFFSATNSSGDTILANAVQDKDIFIRGNDGGSTITALTLDMSDAGTAIFNHDVKLGSGGIVMADTFNNRDNNANIIFRSGSTTVVGNNSTALVVSDSGTTSFGGRVTAAGVTTSAALISTSNSNNLGNTTISALAIDNFTIDGTIIALSSGNMTLDSAGDIVLDSDGGNHVATFNDNGLSLVTDTARLLFTKADGTNISFVGDLTGSGQGGAFFYNQGGTPTIKLNSYEASQINTGIIFNEGGADLDFRVESNGNANMLFVDGGDNRVGVGTGSPSKLLHLSESTDGTKLRLTRGGVCEWDFSIGNTSTLSGVGAGALELLPQNGGTANEFAIGTAGSTAALVHITNSGTTFNNGINVNGTVTANNLTMADDEFIRLGNSNDFVIVHSSSQNIIQAAISDQDIIFKGNDGGSAITALTLDMSAAGFATFNDSVRIPPTKSLKVGNGVPSAGVDIGGQAAGEQAFLITSPRNDALSNGLARINITDSNCPFTGLQIDHAGTGLALDINGKADISSTLAVGGVVTANAGVVVDNITIDGNEIDVGSGDLTLDVAGDIILDADGDNIFYKAGGSSFYSISNVSGDTYLGVEQADKDLVIRGSDGGVAITALTLDMSAAGAATFNSQVKTGGQLSIGTTATGNGLGSFLNQGTGANFYEASDGTKTMIVGTDGGNDFVKLGSLSSHPVGFVAGNSEKFRIATDGSLSTPTAGTSNVRFGVNAGNSITSGGNFNTLIGDGAGTDFTTGCVQNTALGVDALANDVKGGRSVAIGAYALTAQSFSSITAAHNTAVGNEAGASVTTGTENTLIGSLAGDALTDSDRNVALGTSALGTEILGQYSTAIGWNALATQSNSSATNALNTAVGYNSGAAVTTGTLNTLIGGLAGDALTTGQQNVALGYTALSADDVGNHSVAIGTGALLSQNYGSATNSYNTAVGSTAGASVTTGIRNTLIGALAGDALTTSIDNTAIGSHALSTETTGKYSTAVGQGALFTQNAGSNVSVYNTAIGYNTANLITTGLQNTLIGGLAGDALTDADYNTAIGYQTLSADTLGSRNTAVGFQALANQNFTSATDSYNTAMGHGAGGAITTGTGNTFVGGLAGDGTDDGKENVAVGASALSSNCGNGNTALGRMALRDCTGANNTALGHQAGIELEGGTGNTFIGKDAGGNATSAINSVIIGHDAGDANVTTGGTNIVIGYGSDLGGAGQENQIVLATNSLGKGSSTAFISANGGNTFQGNNSANWATVSDERLKKNITNNTDGLSIINSVVVRNFEYKTPDEVESAGELAKSNAVEVAGTQLGVIAQELAEVCADCVVEHDTGVKSVQSDKLNWHMINAIKELSAQVDALTARIETLEG